MGIFSTIFGGPSKQSSTSTQQSSSSNRAYDALNTAFSPLFGNAAAGSNAIAALFGGDTSGFDTFKRNTGFNAAVEQGSRGITGNAAASGLLRSGSTARSLQNYGNQMQNQYYNNYMDRLFQQANLGFQAGNLVSGAGNIFSSSGTSTSTGTGASGGIGGFLGSALSGIGLSDERAKTDIKKLGEFPNGLGIYSFRYKTDPSTKFVGVMAQEVKEIVPEALGPEMDGYMTVDYQKLMEVI